MTALGTKLSYVCLCVIVFSTLATYSCPNIGYSKKSTDSAANQWWNKLSWEIVISVVGGTIAILLSIFKDAIKNRLWPPPRPDLVINPNENPSPVLINLPVIMDIDFPQNISNITARYAVNRIMVRNQGDARAVDCSGLLRIGKEDLSVCWDKPNHREFIAINIQGREYLDLCACLIDDPQEIIANVRNFLNGFDTWNTPQGLLTRERANVIKDQILQTLQTPTGIPKYIAPPEYGWPSPANTNRILGPIRAKVVIHSKDTKPIERAIRILDIPRQDGVMIEFEDDET